jgi:PAS domain S-box-containing protein
VSQNPNTQPTSPVPALTDLEDLFQNAPCGYLSIRPDGRIELVNATFCKWVGYEQAELTGRRLHDLLNVASRIYYETHFVPLLRLQGYFNEVALDLATKNQGRIPVLVNAVERRDAQGQHLFTRITVFNATDRRRYESELLAARQAADHSRSELRDLAAALEQRVLEEVAQRGRAEESLRQSQKMEAIGQLTGGVAHDFNNLLTVILGGLDTIQHQLSRSRSDVDIARVRRACEMGLHATRRAATLTARLLAFSRRQMLDPKPISLNSLVAGIADLLQRTLGETISFETVAGGGLWWTMADPAELENALVNLAVNARDAMPAGGRLTIETSNAYLDDDYVANLEEPVAAGQYVMVAVSDTGNGMDAVTLSRVFEPFFTTKEVGKGTGLGLSQVYGFIRQSGGHVRIYSEVGEGTSVKLYLPRTHEVQKQNENPQPVRSAVGGREVILVVEDHDELREFSVNALGELGYQVIAARSGRAALDLLQRHPDVSLLFTDVILPDGMDGQALSQEATRRRPELKVLFTSGYTRNAIIHNGRLESGVQLLTKPYTYAGLAAKVRALLDS